MARILHAAKGRWYDELRAVSFYSEAELERRILQHANSLFKGHYVIPFKIDVISHSTSVAKRPDLAVIRHDFSSWSLVEVEVKGHSLDHVLEQTSVFADGRYNALELAEYAKSQLKKFCNKNVSSARLNKLFSNGIPSILVVADEHQVAWGEELRNTGIQYGIFEVYKNVAGQFLYRTFGQYPIIPADEAHCRRHRSIPNLFEIIGDFTFKNSRSGEIEVVFDEYLTKWAIVEDAGKKYLRFLGVANPLSPDATYGLTRDKFNKYHFTRN